MGEIRCRQARPSDTPAVKDFLCAIWEGEDYVPEVWDDWLSCEQGLLIAAEYAGRTAGLGRLRDLGWGEWWMEGLRVAPEFQGLGIASRLHEYLLERWLESGGDAIRLATHARRKAVRHLCQRTGFHNAARLGHLSAEARTSGHSFIREQNVRLPPALIPRKLILTGTRGQALMDLSWAWASLREERLRERSASSSWTWQDGAGWAVLLQKPEDSGEDLLIQACAVAEEERSGFFSELRGLACQLGYARLRIFVPFKLALDASWDASGWTRDEDEELLLFERFR
jgi:GNAT superfamily N-acetyltransferase